MNIINKIKLEKKYFSEAIHYWLQLRKYNASINTQSDIEKMQYTIIRLNHTLEKGMSMRFPKKGFGQLKAIKLIEMLNQYSDLYLTKDKDFLQYPITTLNNYIIYTKRSGVEIPIIQEKFSQLIKRTGIIPQKDSPSIKIIRKEDIISEASNNFESLLQSRHSIRYFTEVLPQKDIIEKALNLAKLTPSACNRQGWKTHVFINEKSKDLINWQGGCHGFENEIKCSILVTANLKAFFDYEVHQAYVDGGLYAMNLINAFHSLGLGTIPLSVGFKYQKLNNLSKFNIPKNEVPIVIIGVGYLQDTFKIAISERRTIEKTNTFH